MSLEDCRLIPLPRFRDGRGSLTCLEGNVHVPFEISRVFYLYDVPNGAGRGGHALKNCEQVLIAIVGAFEVGLDDGRRKEKVQLIQPDSGLYIPPKVWRDLDKFQLGSVCLVLASKNYNENDYFRDYNEFLANINSI